MLEIYLRYHNFVFACTFRSGFEQPAIARQFCLVEGMKLTVNSVEIYHNIHTSSFKMKLFTKFGCGN